MPKIDVNKVAEILKSEHADPALLRAVVEKMNLAVQPDPGDGDETPAVKKQFTILVSDPEGLLDFYGASLTGWVLQLPEDASPASVIERIHKAAYDYNASKKGRLYPAKKVGDALEGIPAKFFKEVELWVKTKEPVLVIQTDNEIPSAEGQA